jgi:hypothetical protein
MRKDDLSSFRWQADYHGSLPTLLIPYFEKIVSGMILLLLGRAFAKEVS